MGSNEMPSWTGVPLAGISGSTVHWGAPFLPPVGSSEDHAVLCLITQDRSNPTEPPQPYQAPKSDVWDTNHVKMPCSDHNAFTRDGNTVRRWDLIKQGLSKPMRNADDLVDNILSYNKKYENEWKFRAIYDFFDKHLSNEQSRTFFDETLPKIVDLALRLPDLVKAPIPMLRQHTNKSLTLSQLQVASLLANAFFCTFPSRNSTDKRAEYGKYPNINFTRLYESKGYPNLLSKLHCIINYFTRVCEKDPVGVVTFSRRYVPESECPKWPKMDDRIARLFLHVDCENSLSDASDLIQVDFANKYIGGGVIGHGSVQEEIMFVVRPELLISKLFTEVLDDTEALLMIGCERYNSHSGYSRSFKWTGDYVEPSMPYDKSGRRRTTVLAIDAVPFDSSNKAQEHNMQLVTRELNKAWVGATFFADKNGYVNYPGLATGNWGCGAFGGSKPVKALIQMMAYTAAKRPMAFYTFHDRDLMEKIHNIYIVLSKYNVSIGDLCHYLLQFVSSNTSLELLEYLQDSIEQDAVRAHSA